MDKKSVVRNTAWIAGGAGIGQLLLLASAPILTRLYSPESFGVFGTFTALALLLSSFSTLRYFLAIPLCKSSSEALNLSWACILVATGFTGLIAAGIFTIGHHEELLAQIPISLSILWLIPVGVFLTSLFNTLTYLTIYNKKPKLIASSKIASALGMIAIQLALYKLTSLGLILGHLISQVVPLYIFIKGLALGKVKTSDLSASTLFKLLRKHRNFPKYSAPGSLFYSATQQTPLLIIAAFSGTYYTGLFLLAERLIASPVNMVRESINQSIHKDLAEVEDAAKMGTQALNFCVYLFKMTFPPAVSCIALPPLVIELVLGSGWHATGVLISVLLPFYVINLTFAPSLPIISIMGWQKRGLIFQIVNFLVTSATLIVGLFFFDFILAIALFVMSRLIMVVVNRLLIFRSLGVNISPFLSILITYSILYGTAAYIFGNLSELTGPLAITAYSYLATISFYYVGQLLKTIKVINS